MCELMHPHDQEAPHDEHRPADEQPVGHHQGCSVARPDQVGEDDQARQREQNQTDHRQLREVDPAPVAVGALEVLSGPVEGSLA